MKTVNLAACIVIALVLFISLFGILNDDGGQSRSVHTIRGETVEIYGGDGLYQYEGIEQAYIGKGFDWMNILLALPLFVCGLILYNKGHTIGMLLTASGFFHFFYNYLIAVMAFSFNPLFLAYTALYSASLLGLAVTLITAYKNGDVKKLEPMLASHRLRIPLSVYILILAGTFLILWTIEALTASVTGATPEHLLVYSTLATQATDLGIFVPVTIIGSVLFFRKNRWGGIITVIMLTAATETFASLVIGNFLQQIQAEAQLNGMILGMSITSIAALVSFYLISKGRISDRLNTDRFQSFQAKRTV